MPLRRFSVAVLITKLQSNLVNSKSSGLEVLFRIISCSNYGEGDIKIYNLQNNYYHFFFLSNISFVHVKQTPQGDLSITRPKRVIILASISKNRS